LPTYNVFIDGKPIEVELKGENDESLTATLDGRTFKVKLSIAMISSEEEFTVQLDGKTYKVEMSEVSREKPFNVRVEEIAFKVQLKAPIRRSVTTTESTPTRFIRRTAGPKEVLVDAVTAPMTGRILSVSIKKGDHVKEGQILCVLEAMKMENEIAAPKKGTVHEICVSEGSSVSEGDTLFIIN